MELGEESQVFGQGLRAIVCSNQAVYKAIDSSDSLCTLGSARVRGSLACVCPYVRTQRQRIAVVELSNYLLGYPSHTSAPS